MVLFMVLHCRCFRSATDFLGRSAVFGLLVTVLAQCLLLGGDSALFSVLYHVIEDWPNTVTFMLKWTQRRDALGTYGDGLPEVAGLFKGARHLEGGGLLKGDEPHIGDRPLIGGDGLLAGEGLLIYTSRSSPPSWAVSC